jgi:hypothetical protein
MKSVWIDTYAIDGHEHLVDGARLERDTQRVLDGLSRDGYEVVSVTPVQSGRRAVRQFDSRKTAGLFPTPTVSPDTCASYGYSMTDGVLIVARREK